MKLKTFNEHTLPQKYGRVSKIAKVSFGKTGLITFNRKAAEMMDFKVGDKVTMAQDEEEPGNWYFFKSNEGFALRHSSNKSSWLFNHSSMVQKFIESIGRDLELTHNFLIAGKPTVIKGDKSQYWGVLITPIN